MDAAAGCGGRATGGEPSIKISARFTERQVRALFGLRNFRVLRRFLGVALRYKEEVGERPSLKLRYPVSKAVN